jgi:hypothetical protein
MAKYKLGDRVKVTAGNYKGREGVYKGDTVTGVSMGYVLIDGEGRNRRLWKSSFCHANNDEQDQQQEQAQTDTVTVSREALDRIIAGINGLKLELEAMRQGTD